MVEDHFDLPLEDNSRESPRTEAGLSPNLSSAFSAVSPSLFPVLLVASFLQLNATQLVRKPNSMGPLMSSQLFVRLADINGHHHEEMSQMAPDPCCIRNRQNFWL